MTSINDSIPSELLFRTFQFFDEYEFVKLREVCKSWLQIIDENRLLWQVANLAREEITDSDEENNFYIVTGEGKDPEWNEEVLRLFDEKSRSTLKEVSLKFKMEGRDAKGEYRNRARDWSFREFVKVISKSRSTLRILSIEMSRVPSGLLKDLLMALDYSNMTLVDFRLWDGKHFASPSSVKILRRYPSEVGKAALQVLWIETLPELLSGTDFILHHLVSLSIGRDYNAPNLHQVLKPLAKRLKHLNVFILGDVGQLETIQFPKLEILELTSNVGNPEFPHWILCPPGLKLSSWDVHRGLPSIAGLLIQTLKDFTPLSGRCPLLHTFKLDPYDPCAQTLDLSNLVKWLIERRAQEKAGMEVDGIKMQNIKTIVLPFYWFIGDEIELEQVKSLVETVIDSGYAGEKWEIFI